MFINVYFTFCKFKDYKESKAEITDPGENVSYYLKKSLISLIMGTGRKKKTVLAMQAVEYFKYCLLETKQGEEWPDYSGSEGEGAVSSVSTGVC